MKITIFAAFALLTTLFACQRQVPPAKAETTLASNIKAHPGHLVATFENDEQAAIYFGGGASVLLPAKGQYEINGAFFVDRLGWSCIDSNTGDYIILRKNGFASGKVQGMSFALMPPAQTASAQAPQQ